jgi:hypothetical protein
MVSICFIANFTEMCKVSLFAICFYSGNKVSSNETEYALAYKRWKTANQPTEEE